MGLIKKYTENNCQIAVWKITESLDELEKIDAYIDCSKFKSEKRKKEFLACRWLLNAINPKITITYNKFGAPELDNGEHISISHSRNLVAIIISKTKVGLDIEQIRNNPLKLSLKFISTTHHMYHENGVIKLKETHWFLFYSNQLKNLKPQLEEGITNLKWVSSGDLDSILSHSFFSIQELVKIHLLNNRV